MDNSIQLPPKHKGTIIEYQCAIYFMQLGYNVSIPLGANTPYDLIVEIDHKLYKLQCKSVALHTGALYMMCTTNICTRTRLETIKYNSNDVDFFATFYDDKCYLIPFEEVGSSFILRLDPPKNNMVNKVHWAENYEADYIIAKMLDPETPDNTRPDRYKEEPPRQFYWVTNGVINHRVASLSDMPEGFHPGRCVASQS